MERRIKILYCLTIAAILLFLGMQVYWLYGRYGYALADYEAGLAQRVDTAFNMYYGSRVDELIRYPDRHLSHSQFSLHMHTGDSLKTSRKAIITTYRIKPSELLGVPEGTPLSSEDINKARQMAYDRIGKSNALDAEVREFDASSAPSENRSWSASKDVQLEAEVPFTVEGMDSCLRKAGINANCNLFVTDSMIWHNSIVPHNEGFHPNLTFYYPYSELECKSVEIVCKINPLDVLPGMVSTLVMALILSLFLILCLIWQFSTILKLSRLDKMRNNFVSTMIHELKRPLSTLKMCVSGIENEKMMENPELKKELMYETRNALDNLSAYFSKLRDITFNDVEQIPLNITAVNIHDIFDSVSKAIVIPSGKSVIFRNDIPGDLTIQADKAHFTNIVTNLVENAIKYSGNEVTITGNVKIDDDAISIHIADNGNGIPDADKQRIFQRFYRGKDAASELPGMGLGLAYVKLLTEAHGGAISVDSTDGEGSTFTITLPR